jgi:hypothetical protein
MGRVGRPFPGIVSWMLLRVAIGVAAGTLGCGAFDSSDMRPSGVAAPTSGELECDPPKQKLVLDAPSPRNFWEAATEVHASYPLFAGYDDLRARSTLVVQGMPVALTKGAVWIHPRGHSNTTVMRLRVTRILVGKQTDEVFVSFPTGRKHGEFACAPKAALELYLQEVPWLNNPEIDEPRRGVPAGHDLFGVFRPEGLLQERDGQFVDTPLLQEYENGPSVHDFVGTGS